MSFSCPSHNRQVIPNFSNGVTMLDAAPNSRDLHAMVAQERFRRDLYHRISTFPITVPSLAQRRDDIPLLAASLLKRVAGERRLRFSAAALELLAARDYPGNIRELRNTIERATILADGNVITPSHLVADSPTAVFGNITTDATPAQAFAADSC